MEPGGSEPGGFNSGGQDFGYVSDFGFDHDHHDGHGDHGHGDHGFDHFGDDHGGDHDHDQDHDHDSSHQGQGQGLKSLIAKLLGLDKDAGALGGGEAGGEAGSHGAEPGAPPSQSVMYSSALAGISLSEAFKGIRVTPNFLYLCLFSGFTFWLFVVYWIRHNEPLANQVLGTYNNTTRHAVDDRRLLNSVKDAMPFRTSSTFGDIYTPNVPHVAPVKPIDQELMMKANNARPMPAHSMPGAAPQTLQQKLLSTAARQPYEMSAATSQYANQFVNQSVNQAQMHAGFPQAQVQRQTSYSTGNQYSAGNQYQAYGQSPYAGSYPNTIATAGSYYAMPQQAAGQPMYPVAQPLLAAPHGMGEAQQQFGSAMPMTPYQNAAPTRLKMMINR
ncbi:MAG TPA: hypothetical protein EYN91_02115 [Candidatus Melainabacteria bacterium]|nr:hypothetical protein [Candidatus Melainabacteria bacterium]HIN65471.1 hypothetical protein [Candidatus Obscuribacterales bacterium]